jgi:cell division protein FtsI/penicillin-binding protein 2
MRWMAGAAMLLVSMSVGASGGRASIPTQQALDAAVAGTSAVGVVLDGRDGHLLAAARVAEAGRRASAPGSTLKPFFLAAAIREGRARTGTTAVCRGNLRIAGRNLACTHPREQSVFNAETALAYSCNTWFANLARRFTPQEAVGVLHSGGFGSPTGLTGNEAAGTLTEPENEAGVQLLVLGLDHVAVTPMQLARGYLRLESELNMAPVVRRGLEGSVTYGMAHGAATSGMTIAGKTGTASDAGEAWTHGWFAGIAAREANTVILVVYVPHGNGADAAAIAHRFFAAWGRKA